MDFLGNISNIKSENKQLVVSLATYNLSIEEKLQSLINKELAITIKRKSKKRSLDANSYAWLLMEEIGKATNKSKDEVYLDMLGKYGVFTHIIVKPNVVERIEEEWRLVRNLGEVMINGKSGIQLQCYFGSSTYTTEEMSRFIDGIILECNDLGIALLSDDEINSMKGEWGNDNK